ncbi:IS1096 element passenger TnpR family protein [Acaryochloris marina NIES-2412]|uniref:IS1096 element passenger TnpR family protein n=1 Tax=Acaryochloris marina TaxID=155978 RepID=UPI004059B07F
MGAINWGYAHLLRVLKNPRHSQYEERLEWLGSDFDPKAFDLEEVNQALREFEAGAVDCSQIQRI